MFYKHPEENLDLFFLLRCRECVTQIYSKSEKKGHKKGSILTTLKTDITLLHWTVSSTRDSYKNETNISYSFYCKPKSLTVNSKASYAQVVSLIFNVLFYGRFL